MNICIISSTFLPEMTGAGVHVKNMTAEYSKRGNNVLVICPDYSLVKDIFPNYMDYTGEIGSNIYVRPIPSKVNPLKRDKVQYEHYSQWNLEDYIGSFRPDMIVVEDPQRIYDLSLFGLTGGEAYGKCIGVEYARKNGIPVVAMYHTNLPLIVDCFIPEYVQTPYRMDSSGVYKRMLAEYDTVLCACNEARKFVVRHGLENVKSGVYVGVNQEVFSESGRSSLVSNDESVKLLYAGKLDADKDINHVLGIYSNLQRICPNVSLYIAGGGTGEDGLREICAREGNIKFLGRLEQDVLVKVFNSVDIYLSPHPTETYGLSVLEAMSRGLPVVTADSGGTIDLVEKGVSGFRCTTMDEYTGALKLLVEDANLRFELGQAGKKFAGNYSCNRCAENLLKEFETLIRKRVNKNEKIQLCNSGI